MLTKAPENSTSNKLSNAPKSGKITPDSDRVPWPQKLAWAGGNVCGAVGFNGLANFGKPVLNIIFGLNPALVGTVLSLFRIWDSITDPVMGRISDNARFKMGRRRPFIVIGAILCGLTFPFFWFMNPEWSTPSKVIYLSVVGIVFYSAFTVFSVPWGTLNTELTPSYQERTRLRGVVVMVSTAVYIGFGWVFAFTQQGFFENSVTAMRVIGFVIAGLMIIFGVLAGIVPQERFRKAVKNQKKISIIDSFKVFLKDPNYRKMIGIGAAMIFATQLIEFVSHYVGIFYVFEGDLKKGATVSAIAMTLTQVFNFATVLLLSQFFANADKRKVIRNCLILVMLGTLSKWFLLTPEYPYLMLLMGVYMGPANAAFWLIYSSMQADFPDYDEHCSGVRREGILTALNGWVTKFSVAAAMAGSGVILQMTGFDKDNGGNQGEDTFLLMRLLMVSIPAVFYLGAIYLVTRYPLGREKMETIRANLEERRSLS